MSEEPAPNPWAALGAICIGFFMILVDSTIVTVAMPALMADLHADIAEVVWVTSAYLLAYAVPLLITGRLGDRFGPRRLYLLGLAVFTIASLWCGLTGTVEHLIVARIAQGLGASLLSPQTMAIITRTFPADARGRAMGIWGAVGGLATLVGPILGGVLVDSLGWTWVFFVNVPVGVVGYLVARRLVPRLETHSHRFDIVGVVLSAVGMFGVVFGIQEGRTYDWGHLWGPFSVVGLIALGVVVLAALVVWQRVGRTEPLMPLSLFRDRNFSLANVAISTITFGITAIMFPFMLWAQVVRGYTPTQAALLLAPMAIIAAVLPPFVGRLVDTRHPRFIAAFGLLCFSGGILWQGRVMHADTPLWQILLPMVLLGIANGFMWAPVSSTATRNLPLQSAGAGSGVFNTVRQVGSVLGSASIAALMEARLSAHLGSSAASADQTGAAHAALPPATAEGFARAMGESLVLPAAIVLVGVAAVLCFERPGHLRRAAGRHAASQ